MFSHALGQFCTLSLCSLLCRLDKTSDSRKFGCKVDTDWFERPYKWLEVNFKEFVGCQLKAGHAQLNGSPLFPDFKTNLSRVSRFTIAGQEERRPWLQGWLWVSYNVHVITLSFD